ncbi:hypothetical protein [Nocardia sp. NPDC023988]|uniref:hypothetical protein n=1 Tax=unclassified Nocardia TaxID=2637762 RepID=UPI0033F6F6D6
MRGLGEQLGEVLTSQRPDVVLGQSGCDVVAHDPVRFDGNSGLDPRQGQGIQFREHRGGDRCVVGFAGRLEDPSAVSRPVPVQFDHSPRGRLKFGDLLAPVDQGLLRDLLGDGVVVEVHSRTDVLATDDAVGQPANGRLDIARAQGLRGVIDPEAFGPLVPLDPLQVTLVIERVALADQILDRVGVTRIRVGTRQWPGLDPGRHVGGGLSAEDSDMSCRIGEQDAEKFDPGVGTCQRGGQLWAARQSFGKQLLHP